MRRIVLHRRAVKSLRGMPRDRQAKIVQALEEIAAVQNLGEHPNKWGHCSRIDINEKP